MSFRFLYLFLLFGVTYGFDVKSFSNDGSMGYDSLISNGLHSVKQNNIENAINLFIEAIDYDSSRVEAFYYLGTSYLTLCQFRDTLCEESHFVLSKALDIDPQYRKVYYNRGLSRICLYDFKGALHDFNKAIHVDSIDVDCYVNRGIVKIILKDTIGACSDFNKAIYFNTQKDEKIERLQRYYCD